MKYFPVCVEGMEGNGSQRFLSQTTVTFFGRLQGAKIIACTALEKA